MAERVPYKRKRNPLVEKEAQIRLSLTLVSYIAVYTILLLVFIFLPSILTIGEAGGTAMTRFEAGQEFLFLDQRVVPYLMVVMATLGIHFLFLTHRIFGPMVRFRGVLLAWPDGPWPRIFIKRDKDYHGEVFKAFNSSITKVAEDLQGSRDLMRLALEEIRQADGASPEPAPAEALKRAEEKCRAAMDSLNKYFPPGNHPTGDPAAGEDRADEK